MKNLLWNIVPTCIAFGPLSMTLTDSGRDWVFIGGLMLSCGLGVMYRTICRQQKLIEQLWRERHPNELKSASS